MNNPEDNNIEEMLTSEGSEPAPERPFSPSNKEPVYDYIVRLLQDTPDADLDVVSSDEDDDGGDISVERAGRITKVLLKNFMSYSESSFIFERRMSVFHGVNGIGKSAILRGILFGLGAKPFIETQTKSFIRKHEEVAEISIEIDNVGENAFNCLTYGKKIHVQTILTMEGGTRYLIMDEKGVQKSKRKLDLDAINRHFSYFSNNPMCSVLQDDAKFLLLRSNEESRFRAFLEGTDMKSIIEELQSISEKICALDKNGEQATSSIEKTSAELAIVEEVYIMLSEVKVLQENLLVLENKALWYEVDALGKSIEKQKQKISTVSKEISDCETDINAKVPSLQLLNAKISESRLTVATKENELKEAIIKSQQAISSCEEANLLHQDLSARQDILRADIIKLINSEKISDESHLSILETQREGVMGELNAKRNESRDLNDDLNTAKANFDSCSGVVKQCEASVKDAEGNLRTDNGTLKNQEHLRKSLITELEKKQRELSQLNQELELFKKQLSRKEKEEEKAKLRAQTKCQRTDVDITEIDTAQSIDISIDNARSALEQGQHAFETLHPDVHISLEEALARKTSQSAAIRTFQIEQNRLMNVRAKLVTALQQRIAVTRKKFSKSIRRARKSFERTMAQFQLRGSMKIDIATRTLSILVFEHGALKSFAQLSAGHVTCVQLAFLLSIWKSSEPGFVTLDRIDVFVEPEKRKTVFAVLKKQMASKTQVFLVTSDCTPEMVEMFESGGMGQCYQLTNEKHA